MAEQTQAVESQATGQAPNTDKPDTKTAPGAQDGDPHQGKQGKEQPQTGAAAKVEELPDWAQTEIKNLRKEAAERRKAASDAETAAKAAEEANLADQKRWQELAEKRREERDAFAPKVELADKLTELVTAQYAAEIKAWPEQVRAMAPADDASILAKLEWANKARALATELMADKTIAPGNGRRPQPVGAAGANKRQEVTPIYDVRRNF